MKKALPTFKNKPILAYIHEIENENGEKEEVFGWHAMHKDEDGNNIYDERMIGIIPESSSPTLKYDEDKNKYYVNIDGYIYEEYSHAKDILERMGEASVSIEINVTQLSYDAKEKLLLIEDFYLNGVTILGKDLDGNDVEAGMEGSNIKLTDFSKEHNSMFSLNSDLLDAINKLNNTLASFNIESLEKGGESQMNKFEELLAKLEKKMTRMMLLLRLKMILKILKMVRMISLKMIIKMTVLKMMIIIKIIQTKMIIKKKIQMIIIQKIKQRNIVLNIL